MKIIKDRITLCDLEPEVADMVYDFITEIFGMINEGLVIEHIRKFNTFRINLIFKLR